MHIDLSANERAAVAACIALVTALCLVGCNRQQAGTTGEKAADSGSATATALGKPDDPVPGIAPPPAGVPSPEELAAALKNARPELSAADAARRVTRVVGMYVGRPVKVLDSAKLQGMYRVKWHPPKQPKNERETWITLDGEVMAHGRVDLRRRVQELEGLALFVECLRNWGLRLYVDRAEQKSQEQTKLLEPFTNRVLIDCTGDRKKLCAQSGQSVFPAHVWRGGSEIGPRPMKWYSDHFQCPLPKPDPIPDGTALKAADIAEKVRRMYELATDRTTELGGVREDGDVLHVTILQPGEPPVVRTEVVTIKEPFVLPDAMVLRRDTARLERNAKLIGCMRDQKAQLFAHRHNPASVRALGWLGPFATWITVDCGEKANEKACAEAKLRGYPTLIIGERRLEGPKSRADIEAFAGCK